MDFRYVTKYLNCSTLSHVLLPLFVLFVGRALLSNERAVDMFCNRIYGTVACNRQQNHFARLFP
jgi:hypothetical protein